MNMFKKWRLRRELKKELARCENRLNTYLWIGYDETYSEGGFYPVKYYKNRIQEIKEQLTKAATV